MKKYCFKVIVLLTLFFHINCLSKPNMINFNQAVLEAERYVSERGYKIDGLAIIGDEQNSYWVKNELKFIKKINPVLFSKISERKYYAICFAPKQPMLGGAIWVFIDKDTAELIDISAEK